MKINFGKIKVKNKINVGNIKLGIKKIYPESETLEVIPSDEKQIFNGLYKDVVIKPIPEEYVIPEVIGETLVLSRGNVEGEVLNV